MPRSNRCVVLALVGWLILVGSAPNNRKLPNAGAEKQQADAQERIANVAERGLLVLDRANNADPKDEGCSDGKDNRKSDLCAQWKAADAAEESADWAARGFWLGGTGTALLLWTLIYTARGTRAATEALEMQINSDRPLMQLTDVGYTQFDPFGDYVSFKFGYEIQNLGSTGCWIEQISVGVYTDTEQVPPDRELHAFIAPGKGLTTMAAGEDLNFTPQEHVDFAETPQLICIGALTYKNAAGIRWETGFAVRSIIEDGKGKAFNPYPASKLWFDRRLAPEQAKRWYQRRKE